MNAPFSLPFSTIDAALIDCARRIQLSPTKHEAATQHYEALCSYVDREDSPLHGKVLGCFGSGSFGTGTAIATSVAKDQHDVDVVMELDIDSKSDPAMVLTTLFDAINGEEGSRYHGKVKQNSRCVTVEYEDGVKVDLMPVARLKIIPERASHLFHWKKNESYHKPVDPYDFKEEFNARVEQDRMFVEAFQRQAALADSLVEKAETEDFPEIIPLEQKSPLVVATSLHLHYYEGWLLTGKWLGPERHPGNNDAESAAKKRSATVSRVTSGPSAAVVMARLETFSHP
jgi:hypothetical protein